MMNKTDLNKEYLIRYFPNTKDRHTNQLISLDTFRKECGDLAVYARKLIKIHNNKMDQIEIKLRRGVRFVFVRR